MKRIIILILMAFHPFGCDILSPPNDGKTEISGKIINESTGKVVDNISLILVKGIGDGSLLGNNGYKIVAQTNSDNDGNFSIFYNAGNDKNLLVFYINKEPYNDLYSGQILHITPGTKIKNKNYSVYQNTSLKVSLKFTTQPEPRSFSLWFPGGGTNDTSGVTTRAKGNFYNTIRLNYSIDDKQFEVVDSVFCPIDTITNFVLNL